MIDVQDLHATVIGVTVVPSLTVRFLQVGSLIPEGQDVIAVSPNMPVLKAVEIMQRHGYSQLPVVYRDRVLGVISYRSIATQLLGVAREPVDPENLLVGNFIEPHRLARVDQDLDEIFDGLDKNDVILVGQPNHLQGVVTAMDGLVHLYQLASPFVLLAEIELSLRRLINACVDAKTLKECADISLREIYKEKAIPGSTEEMTFGDYVEIITRGNTWPNFQRAFGGKGDFQRKRARAKLERLRDLRNDVFHFRRELCLEDRIELKDYRDWLHRLAMVFEMGGGNE